MTDDVIRWHVSNLHPHALTLDESPLVSGLITAEALVKNIAALQTPPVILHLRCIAPADGGEAVLIAAGFLQVGIIKLIKIGLPVAETIAPDGVSLHWHKPGSNADWRAWFQAHWDSYRRTHPINIARDPRAARYSQIFGGDDLIEALFVYRDGRLCGFASLRRSQQIGWLDIAGDDRDDAALSAILAAVLRRATAHGWVHAGLEVHDDHPSLWSLSAGFSDVPQETYVMWQRAKA